MLSAPRDDCNGLHIWYAAGARAGTGGAPVVRIETPGAVIRPHPQPESDLLPGADARRLGVQGFVDVSLPDGPGVTVVPLDALVRRRHGSAVG